MTNYVLQVDPDDRRRNKYEYRFETIEDIWPEHRAAVAMLDVADANALHRNDFITTIIPGVGSKFGTPGSYTYHLEPNP